MTNNLAFRQNIAFILTVLGLVLAAVTLICSFLLSANTNLLITLAISTVGTLIIAIVLGYMNVALADSQAGRVRDPNAIDAEH